MFIDEQKMEEARKLMEEAYLIINKIYNENKYALNIRAIHSSIYHTMDLFDSYLD